MTHIPHNGANFDFRAIRISNSNQKIGPKLFWKNTKSKHSKFCKKLQNLNCIYTNLFIYIKRE